MKQIVVSKRYQIKFDKDKYLNDLSTVDWGKIYLYMIYDTDINITANNVIHTITKCINRHVTYRKASKCKTKHINKPWRTTGLLRSIKHKHRIYKTNYHNCKSDPQKAVSKSNKWDASTDALLVMKGLERLSSTEPTPRSYTKRNNDYWLLNIKNILIY